MSHKIFLASQAVVRLLAGWRRMGKILHIYLGGAAMVALALIVTVDTTACAAVQISDGQVHSEPPGYRMPDAIAHR